MWRTLPELLVVELQITVQSPLLDLQLGAPLLCTLTGSPVPLDVQLHVRELELGRGDGLLQLQALFLPVNDGLLRLPDHGEELTDAPVPVGEHLEGDEGGVGIVLKRLSHHNFPSLCLLRWCCRLGLHELLGGRHRQRRICRGLTPLKGDLQDLLELAFCDDIQQGVVQPVPQAGEIGGDLPGHRSRHWRRRWHGCDHLFLLLERIAEHCHPKALPRLLLHFGEADGGLCWNRRHQRHRQIQATEGVAHTALHNILRIL
mmetsp:Transcript_122717/g.261886  ORF Transcript_122717/g.261886 Transcript_122717/m.261886 type:complete len:259 (-) Transcript_122717:1265-2041(-)